MTSLEHRAAVVREAANSREAQQPDGQQQQPQQQPQQEDKVPSSAAKGHHKVLSSWGYLPTPQLYQSLLQLWGIITAHYADTLLQEDNVTLTCAFETAVRLAALTAPLMNKVQPLTANAFYDSHASRLTDTRTQLITTSALVSQQYNKRSRIKLSC